MASNKPAASDYAEVTQSEKLTKKMKDAPFVPIGIAGTIAVLGWAGYQFRHRGSQSPSVFLMHTRVKAQGMIVGAIAIGVGYTLLKDYIFPKKE